MEDRGILDRFSVQARNFSLLQGVKTGGGAYRVSCPVSTGNSYWELLPLEVKEPGCRPGHLLLTSIKNMYGVIPLFPMYYLHGVILN
jgi:hypothetical protein